MTGDSLVGRQVGPFVVYAELGRGGMGVVYRAFQPSLAREVALKVLPQWFASQPGFTARFVSEARAAARLHHPNIVTVHDVGEADGWHFIVMQLLRGQTLEALVRPDGALSPSRVVRIGEQIASALDYAHAEGVVHRDVKPANIIVGDGDHATLTDFGIARIAEQTAQRTMTGTILGTPEYMAPEQAEGRTVTSAADQYALACVLFELLSGHPPFQADTPMGVLMHQMRTPPPRVSPSRLGLPNALDAVFRRGLAKDPGARYRTCRELVGAIATALQVGSTSAVPIGRSAVIVAGVALAALLITGAAVFAMRPPPPQASTPTVAPTVAAVDTVVPTPTPRVLPTALPTAAPVPPTRIPAVVPTLVPPTQVPPPVVAPPPTTPPTGRNGPSGSLVLVRGNSLGGKDLFRMDLTNSGLTRLTGPAKTWNWAPAATCDGQWLAFASGAPGASDIAIERPDGSARAVIARNGNLAWGSPWWMPDGRIAFNGSSGTNWEIYAVSASGGTPTALTNTPNIQRTSLPTWPCQSGSLAIAGKEDANGAYRVFRQSSAGSFLAVSGADSEGYAPAWSPDGRRLAFQSGGGALRGIVTVGPDGSGAQGIAVPVEGAWARAPIWSPDGQWIAYVSGTSQDDNGDVFVVPSNGGPARQLTFDGSTYDWRLAWLQ